MAAASATGAFTPDELDVLREVLTEWSLHPDGNYRLLTEERDGAAVAFLIYGPTPMTAFAY
ncbi:MAG TPA: N-acetyltransferase, partial [Synergistaceae bacterium]|nr:N-acetyltransferase [Synergistaceae bacterium]